MPDDALGFELQFTPRANMGLGVIPRIAAEGRGIYRARLGVDEGLSRLRNFYHPYHDKVKTELDRLYAAFGQSILIDFLLLLSAACQMTVTTIPDSAGTRH